MEPIASDPRPNDVHADIPALRELATAHARHAADLQDVAARLSALTPQPEAFGPIGARFLTALVEAVGRDADSASALSTRLNDGSSAATATATSYDDADQRAGRTVGSLGV
ncbi:hypothetical protein GCM10023114_19450 [Mycolicibacterium sediminis]|uniref:ESX-1 secretion-associated protein n=1 Tax=Mycolicibacterium sediminis TaxID=1286180 RepID=A0A7I7QQ70_9MYCO|nr:hypothetical protein MSEDJ_26240 [Mycolicibacterium sediminis]